MELDFGVQFFTKLHAKIPISQIGILALYCLTWQKIPNAATSSPELWKS
jgi:hypothetical protein